MRYKAILAACFILSSSGLDHSKLPAAADHLHKGEAFNFAKVISSSAKSLRTKHHFWELGKSTAGEADTIALKQSGWYTQALKGIEESEYGIQYLDRFKSYSSPNRRQNLRAFYTNDQFVLTPRLDSADKWKLSLDILGIYTGSGKIWGPVEKPAITGGANRIAFNNADKFITEYVNSTEGVRQNFIIKQEPADKPAQLSVKMRAGKDWVVDLANKKEVHFAKAKRDGYVPKLIYNGLKVWDANNRELAASFSVNQNEVKIDVVTKDAAYPITIDPVSTTFAARVESNQVNAYMGFSVSSAGDVNADGYSDVIVGAQLYDNGQTDEGAAFVYHGSATGISTTAAATLEANQAGANFGIAVGTAGDVNRDGYSDVIVGASLYDAGQTDEGVAFVYHGSASGINTVAATILQCNQNNAAMGISVASAGDVNGDGYSDVIVGAYNYDDGNTDEGAAFVYHGSATGVSTTAATTLECNQDGAFMGVSVASAGDVNGDGYSDVVIGAYAYDDVEFDEGAAFVYHGSASGINSVAAATVECNQDFALMGNAVASAGDVNGDGYSDVLVTASSYDNGQSDEGAAFIYHGSAAGISTVAATMVESNQVGARLGISAACAGDVNGDGYSDIIVGAMYYDNGQTDEGAAFVYQGSAAGINNTAVALLESNQASALMGASVASAGDVNGDGFSDVIVGAYNYDNPESNEGAAFVFNGTTAGISTSIATTLEMNQASAFFGIAVASAGDVNGDGYSDVIIGANMYDNGQADEGAAFVYHGSAAGLSTVAAVTLEANQASSTFGYAVSSAGDVNGDGYSDVIVGAYNFDNGQSNEGAAFIYHGGAGGINSTAAAMLESNQANATFGISVAGAGDVNGDGYSDVIVGAYLYDNGEPNEGTAFVYHGSATGINTTAARMLEVNLPGVAFGSSVAGAGDVNGDGYSDVIVGANQYSNGQSNEGAIYIFHGSASGISATAAAQAESNVVNAFMGVWVAAAGDVNGDGFSDVVTGAQIYTNGQTNEGAIYIFHGSATGINTTPAALIESNQANANLGICVSGAGDVNGDGYSDIIAGASGYTNGEAAEGGAFIYLGSPSGINTTPAVTLESNQANASFGYAVASAGDVNGDGFSDVVAGAYLFDNGQLNEGTAFIYLGNSGSGKRSNLRLYNTDLSTPIQRSNYNNPNLFGGGLFAKSPLGRVKGKLVWDVKQQGQPFSGSPINTSAAFYDKQTAFTNLGISGTELKNNMQKRGRQTKVRARVEYDKVTAITGQVYGPWRYLPGYLMGAYGMNATPLPLTLVAFNGQYAAKDVQLAWITEDETNIASYFVERSTDGMNFTTVGELPAKGIATGRTNYSLLDKDINANRVWYRLKVREVNGEISYSQIITLSRGQSFKVDVLTNPVRQGVPVQLKIYTTSSKKDIDITVVNTAGQVITMQHASLQNGENQISLSTAKWVAGIYIVNISGEGIREIYRVVVD